MPTLRREIVSPLIKQALHEDIGRGDLTSRALIPAQRRIRARVIAKASGVVAGTQVAQRVFQTMDRRIRCHVKRRDGQPVRRGQTILTVEGQARSILSAERTALNFLGHLSGIATLTQQFVRKVSPLPIKILDTRKTLPGLRELEKYAVRMGGGQNHRFRLDDAILIKTNHLRMLESVDRGSWIVDRAQLIQETVIKAKRLRPKRFVEIEVVNFAELQAALKAGPHAILLDNWSLTAIRRAVRLRNESRITNHESPLLEVSGGVTLGNVRRIAQTGIERTSIGRLTHSAPALDVSLAVV